MRVIAFKRSTKGDLVQCPLEDAEVLNVGYIPQADLATVISKTKALAHNLEFQGEVRQMFQRTRRGTELKDVFALWVNKTVSGIDLDTAIAQTSK